MSVNCVDRFMALQAAAASLAGSAATALSRERKIALESIATSGQRDEGERRRRRKEAGFFRHTATHTRTLRTLHTHCQWQLAVVAHTHSLGVE